MVFTLLGFGLTIAAVFTGALPYNESGHTTFNLERVQDDINNNPYVSLEGALSYQAEYNSHAIIVWALFLLAIAAFVIAYAVRTKPQEAPASLASEDANAV